MIDPEKLLEVLVSIKSTTGDTSEAITYLKKVAEEAGMTSRIDRGALVINPDTDELLLLGHIDTVPGNPEVRIDEDEKLWGRGTVDAKGPLCAAFTALSRKRDLWSRVKLIAVPDEEGDSETALWIRDEMGRCPSIILEPSDTNGITISYRGRMLIEIQAKASRSHSGGDDPFAPEILMDHISSFRDTIGGRILEFEGDMESAKAVMDIRYVDEPSIESNDACIKVRVLENVPPVRTDKNNPLVRGFIRAIRKEGERVVFKNKTGTSDMNLIGERWDVPLMAYGPGDGKLDHTDIEHIGLEDFRRSIDIWESFLDIYQKPGSRTMAI